MRSPACLTNLRQVLRVGAYSGVGTISMVIGSTTGCRECKSIVTPSGYAPAGSGLVTHARDLTPTAVGESHCSAGGPARYSIRDWSTRTLSVSRGAVVQRSKDQPRCPRQIRALEGTSRTGVHRSLSWALLRAVVGSTLGWRTTRSHAVGAVAGRARFIKEDAEGGEVRGEETDTDTRGAWLPVRKRRGRTGRSARWCA